MIEMLVEVNMN
jgi:hypothetical protein